MPNNDRSGFVTFLAMTALGWGYYFLIIFVGLWAGAAFQNHALPLPEYLPSFALALGALHGTPAGAAGILVCWQQADCLQTGRHWHCLPPLLPAPA